MAIVTAVACDPETAYVQYAGTGGGKVYKTEDAWSDGGTLIASVAGTVTCLHINGYYNHLVFPAEAHVYIGTSAGAVYRSVDSGASFVQLALPVSGSVAKVVSDPANPLRLDVAIGDSHIRSLDGGLTWQVVHQFTGKALNDLAWQRLGDSAYYAALDSAAPVEESFDDGAGYADGEGLGAVAEVSAVSGSPFSTRNAVAMEAGTPNTYRRSSASGWQSSGSLTGNGQVLHYDLDLYAILYGGTTQRLQKTMDESVTWGTVKSGVNVHDISLGPLEFIPTPFKFIVLLDGWICKYDGEAGAWSSASAPAQVGDLNEHTQRLCLDATEKSIICIGADRKSIWAAPYPAMGPWRQVLAGFGVDDEGVAGDNTRAITNNDLQPGYTAMAVNGPGLVNPLRWTYTLDADGNPLSSNGGPYTDPLPKAPPEDDGIRYPVACYGILVWKGPYGLGNGSLINCTMLYYNGAPAATNLRQYYSIFNAETGACFYPGSKRAGYLAGRGPYYMLGSTAAQSSIRLRGPGADGVHSHGTATSQPSEWLAVGPAVSGNRGYVYNLWDQGDGQGLRLWRYSPLTDQWTDITANLPAGLGTVMASHALWVGPESYVYYVGKYMDGPRVYASRNHGQAWRFIPGLASITLNNAFAIRSVATV